MMLAVLLLGTMTVGPPAVCYATGDEVRPAMVGMDSATLADVDTLIARAIRDGASPGAALAIGRHGKLVRLRGYGNLNYTAGSAAVSPSTLYDVSSLTKVAGTTIGIMRHVEAGLIRMDDPLSRHLPWWPKKGRAGRIRIHHLLEHSSGLPAGADLRRGGRTREARLRRIAKLPIRWEPGAVVMYSDLGMVLLGAVLERQQGKRLDTYLRERVFRPLGLHETLFRPAQEAPRLIPRIAPTELDDRTGRPFRGIVHDPIAQSLGGVAGHAGLFSSARDLATIAQELLNGSRGKAGLLARAATIRAFSARGPGGRGLGFDLPADEDSHAGRYLSASTFGHTGFTGTSMWIDPEYDLYVVLLTNRIHPSATNKKHVALRKELHDLVALSVTDVVVEERAPAASVGR